MTHTAANRHLLPIILFILVSVKSFSPISKSFNRIALGLLTLLCLISTSSLMANNELLMAEVETKVSLDQADIEASPEPNNVDNTFDYRIELLVFAYMKTGDLNSEVWRNPERPSSESFLLNANSLTRQSSYNFLNIQQKGVSELTSIKRKMKVNGRYRILQHRVWEQTVEEEGKQDMFYVSGGNSYLETKGLNNYLSDSYLGGRSSSQDASSKSLTTYKQQELEGTIHIYRSRFLHINTDLWLSEYTEAEAAHSLAQSPNQNQNQNLESDSGLVQTTTSLATTNNRIDADAVDPRLLYERFGSQAPTYYSPLNFHLNQHRRLRSGELHYIDHPRLGLLIKFTRLSDI